MQEVKKTLPLDRIEQFILKKEHDFKLPYLS